MAGGRLLPNMAGWCVRRWRGRLLLDMAGGRPACQEMAWHLLFPPAGKTLPKGCARVERVAGWSE